MDELGKVARGKSRHRPRNDPSLYGGPYPFIQTADITNSELYVTSFSQTYSEVGLSQSKLWNPGVLCIVNAGVNTGDSAILGIKACFPDSVISFTADPEKSDVRFVKYFLDSVKVGIRSITMGATQDNLSVSKLLTIKLPTFDLPTQRKIAGVLSAYDDLIENNRRRIAILENMAEEIYREWFVRMRFPGHQNAKFEKGVPVGWQQVELADLAEVNPESISRTSRPERIQYIDIGTVTTNHIGLPEEYEMTDAPGRARRIVRHGDILWSSVRPGNRAHALVFKPVKNLIASTGFAVLRPKPGVPYSFVYRSVATSSFVDYLVSVAKGAAYPATSFDDFGRALVLKPVPELLAGFGRLTEPMYSQMHVMSAQSSKLVQSRDALLTRLISGKLSVDELDIQMPPSMTDDAAEEASEEPVHA